MIRLGYISTQGLIDNFEGGISKLMEEATLPGFAIGSSEEGLGIVVMTNGKNGQQVYQKILYEIMGGEYLALDWLINL